MSETFCLSDEQEEMISELYHSGSKGVFAKSQKNSQKIVVIAGNV